MAKWSLLAVDRKLWWFVDGLTFSYCCYQLVLVGRWQWWWWWGGLEMNVVKVEAGGCC